LARFVADNIDTFEASDSKLPECAFDQLVDNWKPLFAIAGILLADLKQLFTDELIFSKDSVELQAQNERATLAGSVSRKTDHRTLGGTPTALI
jgi:hypothetical protein